MRKARRFLAMLLTASMVMTLAPVGTLAASAETEEAEG